MKKFNIAVFKSILSVLLVFLIAPAISQAAPIEIKFYYSMPKMDPPVPPANGWHWFAEELEKRSKGKVRVIIAANEALFKIETASNAVRLRMADIANISLKTEADRFSLMSVALLPGITWPDSVEGTIRSSRALMRLYNEFPEIQQEFEIYKVICFNQLPDYFLITKKPVKLPTDLKNLAVSAGGSGAEFIKRQGGRAEAVDPIRSCQALESGVFDGMLLSYSAMNLYQLWKHAQYVTEVSFGRVPLPVLMNKETWDRLPPDVKNLIDQLGDEQLAIGAAALYENVEKGRQDLLANGVAIFTPKGQEAKTWAEVMASCEKIWLEQMKEKGLAETAARVLKRYKELATEAAAAQ